MEYAIIVIKECVLSVVCLDNICIFCVLFYSSIIVFSTICL